MKKNGCSQSQLGVTDDCVVDLPHKCRNALFDALIMIRDSSLKVWKQTTGKQSINLSSCWEEGQVWGSSGTFKLGVEIRAEGE